MRRRTGRIRVIVAIDGVSSRSCHRPRAGSGLRGLQMLARLPVAALPPAVPGRRSTRARAAVALALDGTAPPEYDAERPAARPRDTDSKQ